MVSRRPPCRRPPSGAGRIRLGCDRPSGRARASCRFEAVQRIVCSVRAGRAAESKRLRARSRRRPGGVAAAFARSAAEPGRPVTLEFAGATRTDRGATSKRSRSIASPSRPSAASSSTIATSRSKRGWRRSGSSSATSRTTSTTCSPPFSQQRPDAAEPQARGSSVRRRARDWKGRGARRSLTKQLLAVVEAGG